jgi:hypothetical protein
MVGLGIAAMPYNNLQTAIGKGNYDEGCIILRKGQRAGDPDSYQKSLLDALVQAEMLWDDNRQHVDLAPLTFSRDPAAWGTVITLQDLSR